MSSEEQQQQEGEEQYLEYSDEQDMYPLQRLEQYLGSEFSLQRLVLAREIVDTARSCTGEEIMHRFCPLLPHFTTDIEPAVRQAFAQQLAELSLLMIEFGDDGYELFLNHLLQLCFELLTDKVEEVSASAMEALVSMVEFARPEHVGQYFFDVALELAQSQLTEEHRVLACKIFHELAPAFGAEMCSERLIPILKLLSKDPSFSVRKSLGLILGRICQVVGPQISTASIIPLYVDLSRDNIWGVRKSCVECCPVVSQSINETTRRDLLVPLYERFLRDVSRWVKHAANEFLGQFISTFASSPVPDSMLLAFVDMAAASEHAAESSDLAEYFAFNFPGVLQTVGRERWAELEPSYLKLVRHQQWKIRRCLSLSIHEVARIVGSDVTDSVLFQPFQMFLKDLDEIKVAAASHVADFLESMGPFKRAEVLPFLAVICEESKENWRIRRKIAKQSGRISKLVSSESLADHVFPLCSVLCDDHVAEVRTAAHKTMGEVLAQLIQIGGDLKASAMSFLKQFASDKKYHRRHSFLAICCTLATSLSTASSSSTSSSSDSATLLSLFLDQIIRPFGIPLCFDRVPNVRLQAARLCYDVLATIPTFRSSVVFAEMHKALKSDEDRDVQDLTNAFAAQSISSSDSSSSLSSDNPFSSPTPLPSASDQDSSSSPQDSSSSSQQKDQESEAVDLNSEVDLSPSENGVSSAVATPSEVDNEASESAPQAESESSLSQ